MKNKHPDAVLAVILLLKHLRKLKKKLFAIGKAN